MREEGAQFMKWGEDRIIRGVWGPKGERWIIQDVVCAVLRTQLAYTNVKMFSVLCSMISPLLPLSSLFDTILVHKSCLLWVTYWGNRLSRSGCFKTKRSPRFTAEESGFKGFKGHPKPQWFTAHPGTYRLPTDCGCRGLGLRAAHLCSGPRGPRARKVRWLTDCMALTESWALLDFSTTSRETKGQSS